MKLISQTDQTISIEMTHDQALRLASLIRESCYGTLMPNFQSRVGSSPEDVGDIGKSLRQILNNLEITE